MTRKVAAVSCPTWCTAEHGTFAGEEDYVHTGANVRLTRDLIARLCASVDPDSGELDGPYVMVGMQELTVDKAERVGRVLMALAERAQGGAFAA